LTNSHLQSKTGISLLPNYRLTNRENEIVLLLAKGRNNPYIVEQLNISANTLKTHLRNLYTKCGVMNRQELLNLLDKERPPVQRY